MFAIASWRDSPGMQVSSPSPLVSAMDALRGGKGSSITPQQPPPPRSATGDGSVAADSDPSTAGANAKDKSRGAGAKKRRRKTASTRGSATGGGSAMAGGAANDDIEDFFVHIKLPAGVAVQSLEFELQAQVTPLKMIEVGGPQILFPRKPVNGAAGGEDGDAASASNINLKPVAPSPFQTPAIHPNTTTVSAGGAGAMEEHGLPPMSLPPAELTTASATVHPPAPVPSVQQQPPAPTPQQNSGDYHVSLLFAEKEEAAKTIAFVQRRWPTAVATMMPRCRSILNASLVLKGLPSQSKIEAILEEINKLPSPPSYARPLRSERGIFKGVVFLKYPSCELAEESKLRLEQFVLGSRPLKVEFKKKSAATLEATNAMSENKRSLQQLVRDLRVSVEHEGFTLQRQDLTKDELKVLKQLCQSYGLLFDMTEEQVSVKRVLGANGTASGKPSPALRPIAATPAWAPATPAPLRPMDFKGIRHWKDIRNQSNSLGIVRPLGPEDGKPSFGAGRGRPL